MQLVRTIRAPEKNVCKLTISASPEEYISKMQRQLGTDMQAIWHIELCSVTARAAASAYLVL